MVKINFLWLVILFSISEARSASISPSSPFQLTTPRHQPRRSNYNHFSRPARHLGSMPGFQSPQSRRSRLHRNRRQRALLTRDSNPSTEIGPQRSRRLQNIFAQEFQSRILSRTGELTPRSSNTNNLRPNSINPLHPAVNPFVGKTSAEVVAILRAKPVQEKNQMIQQWIRNWKTMNEKFFIQ